jgi:tetratricopeptide (TPR) repeat protein
MKALTALTAALLATGGLSLVAADAQAQAPRSLNLSREERDAISALQSAAMGVDRAAQDAALAAARARAQGASARYAVAHFQFQIGRQRNDNPMQTQAAQAMIESGLVTPEEAPGLVAYLAGRALAGRDASVTDRLIARLVELQPTNSAALVDYGQYTASQLPSARGPAAITIRTNAVSLFQRAFAADQAAGRVSPESWYLRGLAVAYDGTQPPIRNASFAPATLAFARALVAAYPTPSNWHDALAAYRDVTTDPVLDLDIRRLMRAAGVLTGERDYMDFAAALADARPAGEPHTGDPRIGEARAVIDEGVRANMVETSRIPPLLAGRITPARIAAERAALPGLRTRAQTGTGAQVRSAADNFYAFGQYAEAATLYSLALQKGGEDPNLVNLRLGAALAMAGRRPEAEAALRLVTGPRADLAGFWMTWLARRPV